MAQLQVLLIEDAVGIPILKILEKWGYQVTLAPDGEQAWDLLGKNNFDLFLIDWMLPGISGIDLVERIRQHDHYQHAPIIMISGKTEKADIVTAIGSGVNDYMAKPFTAVQLRDKIEAVWQQHQGTQPHQSTISRIINGQNPIQSTENTPLILLGETANTARGLANHDRRALVDYLATIANTIDSINADRPDLHLGYAIEMSTSAIIERLKEEHIARRVAAVLVSPQCTGSPALMARLVRERLHSDIPIIVCCNEGERVAENELGKYDVDIIYKHHTGTMQWKDILFSKAVEPWIARTPDAHLDDDDEDLIDRLRNSLK